MERPYLQTLILTLLLSTAPFATISAQPFAPPGISYLEANQFSIAKDLSRAELSLNIGYGKEIYSNKTFALSLEGLVWSRLAYLEGFRFPVETADYYFGLSTSVHAFNADWRVRLGHISSHAVDGSPDTVIGGASSHYSREFIELGRKFDDTLLSVAIRGFATIKYLFHQTTKVEQTFQGPVGIEIHLGSIGTPDTHLSMVVSASTAMSPVWPAVLLGFTLRNSFYRSSNIDLYFNYLSGASRAGIEAGRVRNTPEIGMRISEFTPW